MQLRNSRFAFTLCIITLVCLFSIKIINYNIQHFKNNKLKESLFTTEYKTFWNNNTDNLFYDPHTFGINLFNNSCQIMNSQNFRNYLNTNIKCIGVWCYNNYHCRKGNSRDCYNVEHIIDKKSPEFPNCNKDILANYVMAWGTWNQKLGKVARQNYNRSAQEKRLVYGSDIMDNIRQQFQKCCL